MSRPHRWAAGVLVVLAPLSACSDDPAAPDPPDPGEVPAVIAPARQWAGGEVTLTWPWLVGQDSLPVFRIGDSVLAAAQVDDSTVTLTLPQLSTGNHGVTAEVESAAAELAQVAVFGYTSSAPVPWLAAYRPWPSALGTEVVGVHYQEGDSIGTVQILDLATGAMRGTGFPHARGDADEVGLSYRPGVAVIFNHDHSSGVDTRVRYWQLDPAPALIDSLGWDGPYNKVYEFGPDRVLVHHNGDYTAFGWPGAGWFDETGTGRVVTSPDWQRAILFQGHNPLNGPNEVFMFDGVNGRPGYTLPAYRRLIHGAFTVDGMTAFLAVTRQEDPDEVVTLIRVNAATGSLQATTTLPTTYGDTYTTVAVVDGRVLLLFREEARPGFTLRVLRAQDLAMEAELRLPAATAGWWSSPEMAASPDGNAVYLLTFASTGSSRHRVDLLPE